MDVSDPFLRALYSDEPSPPSYRNGTLQMNGDFSSFDASRWCYSGGNNEEKEIIRNVSDVDGDDNSVGEEQNRLGGLIQAGVVLYSGTEEDVSRCWSNQRRMLKLICGDDNGRRKKEEAGIGEGSGIERNDVEKGEEVIEFKTEGLVVGYRHYPIDVLGDTAFAFDLRGCLRRYVSGNRETDECNDAKPPSFSSSTVRCVRISAYFLTWLHCRFGAPFEFPLERLITCIAHMPCLEIFDISGSSYTFLLREIMPVLGPLHQQSQQRQRWEGEEWQGQCRQLKELRLGNAKIETTEEVHHFAACLSQHERWNNLMLLEVCLYNEDGPVCVDPIFRAIGVRDSDGEVVEQMPCLETFRLIPEYPDSGNYYKLDDEEALARLLRKPSIKDLCLDKLIRPRHCHLIQRHLSKHRNIEQVEICIVDDSLQDKWILEENDDEENDRLKEEVARAARCLVQLARDNPNVEQLCLHGSPDGLSEELELWLEPEQREIDIWTALNGNGREHFRDCTKKSPFRWTRRECVDFLSRLSRIDHDLNCFTDSMAAEALFLSVRMRPDLCVQSERGDVGKST